jgi:hypothetical protein
MGISSNWHSEFRPGGMKNLIKRAVKFGDSSPEAQNDIMPQSISRKDDNTGLMGIGEGVKTLKSKQTGAAIVVIVVTMTIVAILGAGMLYLVSSSSFSETFINNREKAYYLAQAGRQYATMTILNAYNTGNIATITGLNGQTFTLDGNQFYLSTNKQSAGITVVESTGIVNPGTAIETKQKIAFTVRDPTVINGAASVGTFSLDSSSVVDGYDSTGGHIYNATVDRPLNLAIVQTNSMAAGAFTLNKSSVIYGEAYCGVGCVPTPCINNGNIFVCHSGSTIQLGTDAATKNNPTPVLTIPTGGTNIVINGSGGSLQNQVTNIGVAGTVTKYRARTETGGTILTVNNSTINITGDVTLIVDNSLTLINASKIVLADGATLVLWINTALSAGGTSKLNIDAAGNPRPPPNMLIKGIKMTTLSFVQNSRTYCSIYAPGADVNIDNTSEVFGSFYANTIELSGGKLHCDMALSQSKNTYVGY